jgi:hypothetical protein
MSTLARANLVASNVLSAFTTALDAGDDHGSQAWTAHGASGVSATGFADAVAARRIAVA